MNVPFGGAIRRLGDRGMIVDLPDLEAALRLHAVLSSTRPAGVEDVVPAARTVAVLFDPVAVSTDEVHTWLERATERMPWAGDRATAGGKLAGGTLADGAPADGSDAPPSARTPRAEAAEVVVIDVIYDGEDLDDVAAAAGISVDDLIARHTAATWRVAFGGFAPGFGYLVTDQEWFDVPRRPSPRTRVPAGAVGLAGAFSGAYPREGPGGWQLIGRTDAPLWRPRSSRPALLTPGTTVRFRAVQPGSAAEASSVEASSAEALAETSSTPRTIRRKTHDVPHEASLSDAADRADSVASFDAGSASVDDAASIDQSADRLPALTVLTSGPQLLVEDLGRPGAASLGAGRSGALDRAALKLANRLLGNDERAAGLEVLVHAVLRFEQPTWFAVTGARGALRLGGHPIEPDAAVHASAGDVLQLGAAERGLRYVVALRGGVAVPLELGSASSDIGARLGPAPLTDGDRIVLRDDPPSAIPAVDALTVGSPADDEVDVHVVAGPRQEWFSPASVEVFYDTVWEVSPESNRVGVRLQSVEGTALQRSDDPLLPAELPSEPMVPGAIQVPPSGAPTVLLADGPVTGGYPVIAVVADADLDLFAQLRPGQHVRFRHAHPFPGPSRR